MPQRRSTPSKALVQKALGTVFWQIRKERDESQEDVAFNAGIHLTTYGNIERGNRNPTLYVQTLIVEALETDFKRVGELLERYLKEQTRETSAGGP